MTHLATITNIRFFVPPGDLHMARLTGQGGHRRLSCRFLAQALALAEGRLLAVAGLAGDVRHLFERLVVAV